MTIKLFLEPDNTVVISCSQCNKTKNLDAKRIKGTRIKAKCTCGHISTFQLEKRRHYRKETDLRGKYRVIPNDRTPSDSGIMTVVNLSRNGVRLKFSAFPVLNIGDVVSIEFNLDDRNHSLVHRDVVVQNIEGPYVGARFHRPNSMDNVIGFYLFK